MYRLQKMMSLNHVVMGIIYLQIFHSNSNILSDTIVQTAMYTGRPGSMDIGYGIAHLMKNIIKA